MRADPPRVWARLAEVGRQTRRALAGLPGWEVAGPAGAGSAITALYSTSGQDIVTTRARLLDEHGIVTTAGAVMRAPRDMTQPLLRISPHVDCTPDDLTQLRQALYRISRPERARAGSPA